MWKDRGTTPESEHPSRGARWSGLYAEWEKAVLHVSVVESVQEIGVAENTVGENQRPYDLSKDNYRDVVQVEEDEQGI